MTPTGIICRGIVGGAVWDSSAATRLRTIMRDSSSFVGRAATVRATFPDLVTFEMLETRACALIGHGVASETYLSFIDSVVPRVLSAPPAISVSESAPRLIAPEPGSRFDIYPRKTTVWWHSVPGADHYLLEVEILASVQRRTRSGDIIDEGRQWLPHGEGLHSAVVRDTVATFFFVAANPGRWRVRATFADGRTTPAAEWRTFEYSQ
jgi:hypothetical protein